MNQINCKLPLKLLYEMFCKMYTVKNESKIKLRFLTSRVGKKQNLEKKMIHSISRERNLEEMTMLSWTGEISQICHFNFGLLENVCTNDHIS